MDLLIGPLRKDRAEIGLFYATVGISRRLLFSLLNVKQITFSG
jgi:hypothetical protein